MICDLTTVRRARNDTGETGARNGSGDDHPRRQRSTVRSTARPTARDALPTPYTPYPPQALQATERRLVAGLHAIDELMAAISLVTSAYHLRIAWCDEGDISDRAAALTPRLASWLARETPPRCILALGDPVRQTIHVSRRALRLFTTRSQHPVAMVPLTTQTAAPTMAPTMAQTAYGPVARLALLQADGLLAIAARMAFPAVPALACQACYVVTAPHGLAETNVLPDGGVLSRVLAFPRASESLADLTAVMEALAPTATGDSGPLV